MSTESDVKQLRYRLIDMALDLREDEMSARVNEWCRNLFQADHRLDTELERTAVQLKDELEAESLRRSNETIDFPVLEVNGVSKTYTTGGFTLSNVSLRMSSGQITGIVGENGNGKTTLLNLVAGNLHPDAGTIEYPFLGHKGRNRYTLRENIGFIPQRIPRWHGKLKESLHFAASCFGIYGKSNEIRVEQILHRLDLWKFNEHSWNQISSGYKTRFEIARVLLGRPELLVLDEPLSNLDINAQQVLLNDLRQIAKSRHFPMAILMSSQQLHEIEKASDNIIFLKSGRCVFQSEHDHEQLTGTIVEVDFTGDADALKKLLEEKGFTVRNNGAFYLVSHEKNDQAQEIVQLVAHSQTVLKYFRDISSSAKRFFN